MLIPVRSIYSVINIQHMGRSRDRGGLTVCLYLCCFDDLCEVVQDGPDIIFQPLVVALQQSLFALREHSLSGHRAQEPAQLPVHVKFTHRHPFSSLTDSE